MAATPTEGIWIENPDGERERVVAVEYQDGHPVSVLTEEQWDHSRKPWFVPGRDRPNGTSARWYDFHWCKRDETIYYHLSGSGGEIRFHVGRFVHPDPPPAELWVAPGIPVVTDTGSGVREIGSDAELLSLGYRRIPAPRLLASWDGKTRDPFAAGQESETVYCSRCRDDLPSDRLCEHVDWCDECCVYVYADDRSCVDEPGKCDCPGPDGEDDGE